MFSNKKLIAVVDIGSVFDPVTGDRTKAVTNGRKIVGKVDLVGVQTQQLSQIQNMLFSYAVEVDRMYYNNEKYVYFDKEAYEISTATKAKEPQNMLLIVSKIDDDEVKEAIELWLS